MGQDDHKYESNEALLEFVKKHLPNTEHYAKTGSLLTEKYYKSLKRWELVEWVNYINQQSICISQESQHLLYRCLKSHLNCEIAQSVAETS